MAGGYARRMDAPHSPALDITDEAFDALVEEAFDEIPAPLLENIDNLIFVVEDEPEDGSDMLGYYEGTALTEREMYGYGQLPDRIVLFKGPLTRLCGDEDELYDEIVVTLVHELGHYHGIEEDRLHELGWG